jgi:hypothetical protein
MTSTPHSKHSLRSLVLGLVVAASLLSTGCFWRERFHHHRHSIEMGVTSLETSVARLHE